MSVSKTITEALEEFLREYYYEDVCRLAKDYPKDQESLWVDYQDLWRFDPDIADDLRNHPDDMLGKLEEALTLVDIPLDVDLSQATVRVTNVEGEYVYGPGELRSDHAEQYIGVKGNLDSVTTTSDLPEVVVFECERDGAEIRIPQPKNADDLQEPHECPQCERQGPFIINHARSEWSDYARLRVESRPDVDSESDGSLEGFVLNDLIDTGGEDGLLGRVGEPVTIYGVIRRQQKTGRGANKLLFDHVLEVKAVEFDRDDETVDISEHKDEFMELADRPDAVDLFAESIAPQLHTTGAWDAAMEFAVPYLFGAPRIDIEKGATYRGDLHFLIISDYGMGKSTFKEDIESYSPKCLSKSTTALSSGVGLTAAAVEDDFGDGQWAVKPGLLVRANGGHLLLDEIDKGPDELTDMNDALEGEQVVDVEKAGQSATYQSRTAVMAMGNPKDGRFNNHEPTSHQLGIKESLLSRFDGIVTMQDQANEDQDAKVAEAYGKSYTEAQANQYGDSDEFDQLDRPVPIDVGQAWIQYARENVNPTISYKQFKTLKEWYAEEVRQLNETYAGDGEGQDMPVPATVRDLGAAVKMAVSFARVHLRDEVVDADVERAKKLGKKLVSQNWDGEKFDANPHVKPKETQQDQIDAIHELLEENEPLTAKQVRAQADSIGVDPEDAEHHLENLSREGRVYEPAGVEGYKTT